MASSVTSLVEQMQRIGHQHVAAGAEIGDAVDDGPAFAGGGEGVGGFDLEGLAGEGAEQGGPGGGALTPALSRGEREKERACGGQISPASRNTP